jgi:elongation factor G
MAASIAVKEGISKAKPIFLEPVMEMEIMTPAQFLGDIVGDLNSRRAHIEGIETYDDLSTIRCLVPLAETFGFASNLRSLSQGRATHTMQFHCYEELPANLTEQIVARMGRGK